MAFHLIQNIANEELFKNLLAGEKKICNLKYFLIYFFTWNRLTVT